MTDEMEIRRVVDQWMKATKAGDLETVLSLMTEDVVFPVPRSPPFGKREFSESSKNMQTSRWNLMGQAISSSW